MSFLKNMMKNDFNSNGLFSIILQKLSNTCEKKALETLEKLDKKILIKICEMIKKYREAFHFLMIFL